MQEYKAGDILMMVEAVKFSEQNGIVLNKGMLVELEYAEILNSKLYFKVKQCSFLIAADKFKFVVSPKPELEFPASEAESKLEFTADDLDVLLAAHDRLTKLHMDPIFVPPVMELAALIERMMPHFKPIIEPVETSLGVGNAYGGLEVRSDENGFCWRVNGYEGDDWEEIPESLYNELMLHHEQQ